MTPEFPLGTIQPKGFMLKEVVFPFKRVSEFSKLQYGKSLVAAKRNPGNIPMYGTNGRCGWHDQALHDGPGVILGRKGQGHLGVKWCDGPFWVIDTAYIAEIDENTVDLKWFYYITKFVGLDHIKTGEKPGLNRDTFGAQVFPFPDKDEQESIGNILGVLDEKIKLNQQMNHTLEAMAQAIFKSWFVDFDPVTAKAEGRQPYGMNAGTAAMFPSHFVESELGPIPQGWEVSSIADLARYVNGKNFTKNATGTGRMVIRIAELNSGAGASTVYNEIEAHEDNTAYPADLLFSWSGSLDVYRWHQDEALVNQHIFKVIPHRFPQWFVYFQLREAISFFQGIAADKATTMGHIKREHLSQSKLALPIPELIAAMDGVVNPIYQRIHQNERESITLSNIRDALLPKLLSGVIRVKGAEKQAEAVA